MNGYLGFNDMIDGGGPGRSGDRFEGGGFISALANLFATPLGSRDRAAAASAPATAAPAPAAGGGAPVMPAPAQATPQPRPAPRGPQGLTFGDIAAMYQPQEPAGMPTLGFGSLLQSSGPAIPAASPFMNYGLVQDPRTGQVMMVDPVTGRAVGPAPRGM